MFGFLKDKLKSVVAKFSKKVEEEGKEEINEIEVKTPKIEKSKSEKKHTEEKHKSEKKQETKEGHKHKKSEKKQEKPKLEIIPEEINIIEESPPVESEQEIKEEIEVLEQEEKQEKQEKKGFFSRLFGKKEKSEEDLEKEEQKVKEKINNLEEKREVEEKALETIEEAKSELKEDLADIKQEKEEIIQEKKGFFAKLSEKISTRKINEKQFEEIFWELELALLESNVAVEVIEKIKDDLKQRLVDQPLKKSEINNTITNSLKESIVNLFDIPTFSLLQRIKEKKPLVICFIGINGSGKTTTIAKIAHLLQKHKISCVMAAADTFRAAAIQQLEEHANNLKIKMIKHDYGADSAAVAFDAVKHAEARHIDVVLIDTAGRLHSNEDLMKEMQKLVRVAKPDLKIFIGESITGNDCVEQAKKFNELIGIDAIILSKADIDDKGGAAISVSYITKKPILYLGTGQTYEDLKEFNKEDIIKSLGL